MKQQTKNTLYARFLSFIGMGVFIALFIVGIIFFSYLLIIGGIIGLIIFCVAYFRMKFLMRKFRNAPPSQGRRQVNSGRTIDQE